EKSDSRTNSCGSTVILDEVPSKRQRFEDRSLSSKQMSTKIRKTLTDGTRRQMVNILVNHMIDIHGLHPTKAVREEYALGIVLLFPSLKDPYSKKGHVNQDFTLLFEDNTSSRLLKKWDVFFKPFVIKEAKWLTSTPELCLLMESAESLPGCDLHETTGLTAISPYGWASEKQD
uniref:Uncharacterized protein n=1 Tax=Denticeps clupeoides TaxID=299321 RepID=A0AAY4B166_9TELE